MSGRSLSDPSAPAFVDRAPDDGRLTYQPALDGVRAIAVIGVVLFHSGLEWASGGYLGVSVFFTLSGFLITTLLMTEHGRAGAVDLGRFYARRLRRLVPASVLALLAIVLLARFDVFASRSVGSDVRWAAISLANWNQLSQETRYADVFTSGGESSPVLHFWSLSIEEQFYLVVPAVLVATMVGARAAHRLALVLAVPIAVSVVFVAGLAADGRAEEIYLHTVSRMAELLVGCLAAVVIFGRTIRPSFARWAWLFAIAIVASFVLTGDSTDAWPYHGWLPVFAVLSALLVVSLQGVSRTSSVLSLPVLGYVGRTSYGIYLYHWPIFLIIEEGTLGLEGPTLHGTRFAVVIVVSAASFRWIEQPIRRSQMGIRPSLALSAAAIGTVVVATLVVPAGGDDGSVTDVGQIPADAAANVAIVPTPTAGAGERDATQPRAVTAVADPEPTALDTPTPTDPPADVTDVAATAVGPTRIVVVGDSTAVAIGSGLVEWADRSTADVQMGVAAHGACGLVRGGEYRRVLFNVALNVDCPELFGETLPTMLDTAPIDVVMLMVSLADTWERSWDGGSTWYTAADDEFRRRLEADYSAFVDEMVRRGVGTVVWARPPTPTSDAGDALRFFDDGSQDVVQSVVESIRADHPDTVRIVDLEALFDSTPLGRDPGARPDGLHLDADASRLLAEQFLGDRLLAIAAAGGSR